MGKSTEPPYCKSCQVAHRGTCSDYAARGAISVQMEGPVPGLRNEPAKLLDGVVARVTKVSQSSGDSSAVERRPSKSDVEGSTPSPRSKKSSPAKEHGAAGAVVLAARIEPTDRAVSAKRGAGTKSTAVGKDRRPEQPGSVVEATGKAQSRDVASAGTQAPPVDTKPKRRGRPATGFDKKAYDRQKAAERRAKLKPTT